MKDIDDSKAPLLDHLIELRTRLLWSVATLLVAFVACLFVARPILSFLVQPLKEAGHTKLIYTDVFEGFYVEVKVALFAAFMIAFPVMATQIWKFVAPGLYSKEKKALLPFLLMTPVLFTLGAAFAYYFCVPVALKYLLGFSGNIGGVTQEALPGIGNYLSFITKFLGGFGVGFLLPILLMLLERAGIVTRQQLVDGRRYAIVGSSAIAAVLTPPDAVSMLLLAVPLCILYEAALIAIWLTERKRAKEVALAE